MGQRNDDNDGVIESSTHHDSVVVGVVGGEVVLVCRVCRVDITSRWNGVMMTMVTSWSHHDSVMMTMMTSSSHHDRLTMTMVKSSSRHDE